MDTCCFVGLSMCTGVSESCQTLQTVSHRDSLDNHGEIFQVSAIQLHLSTLVGSSSVAAG